MIKFSSLGLLLITGLVTFFASKSIAGHGDYGIGMFIGTHFNCLTGPDTMQCWRDLPTDPERALFFPPDIDGIKVPFSLFNHVRTVCGGNEYFCVLFEKGLLCLRHDGNEFEMGNGMAIPDPEISDISCGENQFCFTGPKTNTQCIQWGSRDYTHPTEYKTNIPSHSESATPPLLQPERLSVTDNNYCGIEGGKVRCWSAARWNASVLKAKGYAPIEAFQEWSEVPRFGNPRELALYKYENYLHLCVLDDSGVNCWNADAKDNNKTIRPDASKLGVPYRFYRGTGRGGLAIRGTEGTFLLGRPESKLIPLENFGTVQVLKDYYALSYASGGNSSDRISRLCLLDANGTHCSGENSAGKMTPPPSVLDYRSPNIYPVSLENLEEAIQFLRRSLDWEERKLLAGVQEVLVARASKASTDLSSQFSNLSARYLVLQTILGFASHIPDQPSIQKAMEQSFLSALESWRPLFQSPAQRSYIQSLNSLRTMIDLAKVCLTNLPQSALSISEVQSVALTVRELGNLAAAAKNGTQPLESLRKELFALLTMGRDLEAGLKGTDHFFAYGSMLETVRTLTEQSFKELP